MKELASKLQSLEVCLIPREDNIMADALAGLATTTFQNLTRSIFMEVLPKSSTECEAMYVFQVGPPPLWMADILSYKQQDTLPSDKAI